MTNDTAPNPVRVYTAPPATLVGVRAPDHVRYNGDAVVILQVGTDRIAVPLVAGELTNSFLSRLARGIEVDSLDPAATLEAARAYGLTAACDLNRHPSGHSDVFSVNIAGAHDALVRFLTDFDYDMAALSL